jgi:hypothetical protein
MPLKNQWLRDIIGDAFTEEMDKLVAKHIGENFVSKTDFNTKAAEAKGFKESLDARDAQLTKLQALKPEEMQATITQLKADNAAAAAQYQKDLDKVKIDMGVESQLTKAGAVSVRAMKALVDYSKLSLNPDGTVFGLSEQLSTLQKTEKWGFTAPGPSRTHQGGLTPTNEQLGNQAGTGEKQNNTMNSLIRGTYVNKNIGDE